ncbi:hypothetical protein CDIK_0926 [Cucumispora dikerogammari]|nr:hypothetical protein CDIK_0926 [Cucumispora dikerogammari]
MTETPLINSLIKYILFKKYPLSVLSNYLYYKEVINKKKEHLNEFNLHISAVYLCCKSEGLHLSVEGFRKSVFKYLNASLNKSLLDKSLLLNKDLFDRELLLNNESLKIKEITSEELLSSERILVEILDYKFIHDCLFKKLYGVLIIKQRTGEFETCKEAILEKILEGKMSVDLFDDYLRSI